METFENLTQQMPIFYRQHVDVAHGGKVDTLTEVGLYAYFLRRQTEEPTILENVDLIIDYNLDAGPSFSEEARGKLREAFSQPCEHRKSFIVHRDGHTVAVIREGNNFLLLDSYNAHGAKDHDHFPLLEIIRECNPEAQIYTLYDKIQNDYYSCRIFSVENIVEIEKYCRENRCGLLQVIRESELVPPQYCDRDETKDRFYTEHNIIPIGIPIPILHHVQSLKILNAAFNALLNQRVDVSRCLTKLEGHLRDGVNQTIKDMSDENAGKLAAMCAGHQISTAEGLTASVQQRLVVERMSTTKNSTVLII